MRIVPPHGWSRRPKCSAHRVIASFYSFSSLQGAVAMHGQAVMEYGVATGSSAGVTATVKPPVPNLGLPETAPNAGSGAALKSPGVPVGNAESAAQTNRQFFQSQSGPNAASGFRAHRARSCPGMDRRKVCRANAFGFEARTRPSPGGGSRAQYAGGRKRLRPECETDPSHRSPDEVLLSEPSHHSLAVAEIASAVCWFFKT